MITGCIGYHRWLRRNCIVAALLFSSSLAFAQVPPASDELPLSGPAYVIATEAYDAYGRGDYETAVSKAREAIRQRPDVARLRLLLVRSLRALGQLEAAANTAQQFIVAGDSTPELRRELEGIRESLVQKPDRQAAEVEPELSSASPAIVAADDAYKAYSQKEWDSALLRAQEAARLDPENRSYRLLLVNTLAAAGKTVLAEQEIGRTLLKFGPDRELLQQRGYLRQKAHSYAAAASDFEDALRLAASARDKRLLRLSLADAATASKQSQRAFDALAPLAGDKSYDVTSRRAYALLALGRKEEALTAFALAAQNAPTSAQRDATIAARINILVELDHMQEAREVLETALAGNQLANLPRLELAYLAVRTGNVKTADAEFRRVEEKGQLKGKALLDAAYAAKKVFDNKRAEALMRTAIDAHEAGEISLDRQYLFELRREVADLSRNWGAYVSVLYGAVGVMPNATFAPASAGNVTQTIKEVYWRPPGIGYRNGALVELFVRSFTTLEDDTDGPIGVSTMQGAIGARWKPFSDYNLILEASRLFRIGKNSRNDTLLRIAFSESRGTDLRVDEPSWWMGQVYGEVGRYLEEKQNIATFEARLGRSFRLDPVSDRLVISPFLAIGGSFDSLLATKWAVGAGAGLNARFWFREDKYTAPMSYIDANVQYRFKLGGDDRAEGLFAGLTVAY